MKSWTTRRARARWCRPPPRSARGGWPARRRSRPRRCARAMPPGRPPQCQRKERRSIAGAPERSEGVGVDAQGAQLVPEFFVGLALGLDLLLGVEALGFGLQSGGLGPLFFGFHLLAS